MDTKEMGVNTRNLVDSAQERYYFRVLVNAALNLGGSLSHGVRPVYIHECSLPLCEGSVISSWNFDPSSCVLSHR